MTKIPVAILAAGRGSRLGALTADRPKCLLAIGEASPLSLALEAIAGCPELGDVQLVVGHAQEAIERFLAARSDRTSIRTIFNPRHDTANNIVSALLLRAVAADGLVLLNSDVVCDPEIVRGAATRGGSFLVVDPTRPIRDEAMKVRYQAGGLVEIGKTLDASSADGEYIGLCRFDAAGAAAFFAAIDEILAAGGDGEWYEAAIGRAASRTAIGLLSTEGRPWIEIDDPADLARARDEVLPRIASARFASAGS